MRLSALCIQRIYPVIADQRISHRNDLAAIRRVRQDLLIPRHGGIEAYFPDRRAVCAEGLPEKCATILQSNESLLHSAENMETIYGSSKRKLRSCHQES